MSAACTQPPFQNWIACTQPIHPVGKTTPPAEGKPSSDSEDTLIQTAMKEHKDYGEAISGLQRKFLRELQDQGVSREAALTQCKERYPKIFAV